MAAVRGLDVLVYIGETVLGAQKNCTLSLEADTIDVSNKNSFGWSDFISGTKNWSVSCDGQFTVEDTAQATLMDAFVAGTFVDIEMKNADSSIYYKGQAAIASIELEAAYDDVFAYSVEFTGKGALTTRKQG